MNKVINKYLISGFLKIIINTILVFICLGIILNLFEEIEFAKNLEPNISLPILLTLMYIPNLIIKLLPFIIFIASMWYFISIKTNTDLLSLKVFGFSNLKIILILSFTAFLFGTFIIFAINPVTSAMIKSYEKTKADYSRDVDHLFSINKNGVWIKESENENLRITTAKKLSNNYLINITIYKINNKNEIVERIESKKADISTNIWKFDEVNYYDLQNDKGKVVLNDYELNSIYDVARINNLYKNLDTISFFELISDYDLLIKKGYTKEVLNEKLNLFFSLPFFLFLMVVLASIFTVGSVNKSQNLYYIFISIISCVVIYYFKDLSIALGQTNRISLGLSVWMTIIAISLFCSIGILQINEK